MVRDQVKKQEGESVRARDFRENHLLHFNKEARRIHISLSPKFLWIIVGLGIIAVGIPWLEFLCFGLPPQRQYLTPEQAALISPHGFPGWVRLAHFVNFVFLILLARSGLSILMDHPRLYFDRGCTPGNEIIKFTPVVVPTDRLWTAKDDDRYISPILALPGGRHTVGVARSWHFISVFIFLVNGLIFVALLFLSDQWKRLVPVSASVVADSWNVWVHYSTFHFPTEPNGFYNYNPLQQLSYFGVVFVMGPLSLLTGLAMSPAIDNRFPWYAKLFAGRQGARLFHFLLLVGYVVFTIIHVSLVAATGLSRNMNHIVFGTDVTNNNGLIVGIIALIGVVLICVLAHYVAWNFPSFMQKAHRVLVTPFLAATLEPLHPAERFTEADISPYFWPNGKLPVSEEWKALEAGGFESYRLKISGLVKCPIELSLEELRELCDIENISQHQCIQGWSGIAKWTGVSMRKIVEMVEPTTEGKVVAFLSYGEGSEGGQYYDTQSLQNVLNTECMLAFDMNGKPLPSKYGAPLRLRVENQLGYKMVKWIEEIKFIRSSSEIGYGHGGKQEDVEFFDLIPNI